jgi:CheY-like chemotaxis protein
VIEAATAAKPSEWPLGAPEVIIMDIMMNSVLRVCSPCKPCGNAGLRDTPVIVVIAYST